MSDRIISILWQAAWNERQEAALSNVNHLMTFNTGQDLKDTVAKYSCSQAT